MRELYPEIQPFTVHRVPVEGGHELYVEECGNAGGIPLVFLHGGPGSGCNENHRRYFDPSRYRVILFDQRGCHRSAPRGAVAGNTTQDLIADMEVIRDRLQIGKWTIYGGSWGATLGLLYAQQWPQRVASMILRGVFLARSRDLAWFLGDGANRMFPDAWAAFVSAIPESERADLVSAYHRRIHGPDPGLRLEAARQWSRWGARVTTYLLPPSAAEAEDPEKILSEARIETHYALNRYFISEDQILREAGRLPPVPIRIIHGRRDLTCTLESSWALHRAIPESVLNIVEQGGHLAGEPVMTDALVQATDGMAESLR
jgi:proline iminopeptidase